MKLFRFRTSKYKQKRFYVVLKFLKSKLSFFFFYHRHNFFVIILFSPQSYNNFFKAQKILYKLLISLTQNLQTKIFILRKFHFGIFVKFLAKKLTKIGVNFSQIWSFFTKSRFKFSKVRFKFLKIGLSEIKSPDFFAKNKEKIRKNQRLFLAKSRL